MGVSACPRLPRSDETNLEPKPLGRPFRANLFFAQPRAEALGYSVLPLRGNRSMPPSATRRHADTLFPVRHPDILYLRRMPKEFFALGLFGDKPIPGFAAGNPGGL